MSQTAQLHIGCDITQELFTVQCGCSRLGWYRSCQCKQKQPIGIAGSYRVRAELEETKRAVAVVRRDCLPWDRTSRWLQAPQRERKCAAAEAVTMATTTTTEMTRWSHRKWETRRVLLYSIQKHRHIRRLRHRHIRRLGHSTLPQSLAVSTRVTCQRLKKSRFQTQNCKTQVCYKFSVPCVDLTYSNCKVYDMSTTR